jgi:hypothetical protein
VGKSGERASRSSLWARPGTLTQSAQSQGGHRGNGGCTPFEKDFSVWARRNVGFVFGETMRPRILLANGTSILSPGVKLMRKRIVLAHFFSMNEKNGAQRNRSYVYCLLQAADSGKEFVLISEVRRPSAGLPSNSALSR